MVYMQSSKDMKVSKEIWKERMGNLQQRRQLGTKGFSASADRIRDYKSHLEKVFVGSSLLDVGCGDMFLKTVLPEGTTYTGMDAFPVNDKVALQHTIEDSPLPDNSFDTVCMFATLDGCQDFNKALDNVKRIAGKNVVLLTGVDIAVDQYHTFQLSLKLIDDKFADWKQGYRENLATKVWLLEYKK